MYLILVVDDEKNIADGIAYVLETGLDAETDVRVCYSASEAKKFASENLVDIIVCDINMPGGNGLSLCKELAAGVDCPEIVFLTGYSDFSYTYEALKLPDASYILKLEDDSVLLDEIRRKIAKIDKEREKKVELTAERSKNKALEAEIGGLKLSEVIRTDDDDSFDDSTFLLAKIFNASGRSSLLESCSRTELDEDAYFVFIDNVYLVALPARTPKNILTEKAKRLQQSIYESEQFFSVFVFENEREGSARKRYAALRESAEACASHSVLYFIQTDFSGAKDKAKFFREDDFAIKRIVEYIDGHLNCDLSLNVLSDMVHYNPSYLSRRFKQAMNVNLSAYISDKRLDLAQRLLAETDLLIKDVALRCGFPNPTRFGIAFVKRTGCAPNIYRKKQ